MYVCVLKGPLRDGYLWGMSVCWKCPFKHKTLPRWCGSTLVAGLGLSPGDNEAGRVQGNPEATVGREKDVL
jgi:hypothetical protein